MLKYLDRVQRFDSKYGATITWIEGDICEISYDEGGSGFWPMDSLELIPQLPDIGFTGYETLPVIELDAPE